MRRLCTTGFTKDFKDMLFVSLKESLKADFGADNVKLYEQLKSISRLNGIQARVPFVMSVK